MLAFALAGCGSGATAKTAPAPSATTVTPAIKLDHFGYRPADPKLAVFSTDPGPSVELRTPDGVVVLRVPSGGGSIESRGFDRPSGDRVFWVDFSPLESPGTYHVWSPALGARSYEFVIKADVYHGVLRAALRTFFLQRCGVAKASAHAGAWADASACHERDAHTRPAPGHTNHGLRDLRGGWHDAGDYNKYVWTAVSNAILFMLRGFESNPRAFRDDLDIPESGNGVPDLLDEVRFELDFLLRMQLPDGSVLSQTHASNSDNGASPPSADATVRHYLGPSLESGAVFAGSCALGARVYAAAGQTAYADRLRSAALRTWAWLATQGDSREKAWAAAEVFRMDASIDSARVYIDGYHPAAWRGVFFNVMAYDTQAALAYLETPGATPEVVASMRANIAAQVEYIFANDDLYASGMPDSSYYWGSNAIRAGYGVFLLHAARLGATGSRSADEARRHALDLLHFFHGQNPLSMVYLTGMASLGGEHSAWQIYHHWFGASQSPHSRANYLGKPTSVAEPHYPYFAGIDNLGVRDDKAATLGPPPGFVPGGPNKGYSGVAVPPQGAPPNRCYRDWSDQRRWTARTWEISETSISYQGPYVALVAAFVAVR